MGARVKTMIGSARFSRSYGFTHGSMELQPVARTASAENQQTADAHTHVCLLSLAYSFSIDRICVR